MLIRVATICEQPRKGRDIIALPAPIGIHGKTLWCPYLRNGWTKWVFTLHTRRKQVSKNKHSVWLHIRNMQMSCHEENPHSSGTMHIYEVRVGAIERAWRNLHDYTMQGREYANEIYDTYTSALRTRAIKCCDEGRLTDCNIWVTV